MAEAQRSIVSIQVSPVTPFDPHGDTAGVYQRWSRWLRSFEIFADASGCVNDGQKKQLLLHCAGPDTQDIYYTFPEMPTSYQDTKEALSNYFKPAKNLPYNRHLFRQTKQAEDETMGQFVTRLRQSARDCDFGDKTDEFIRDQVIDRCHSEQLRTKFLAEKELTLAKVLSLAAAKELSEKQSSLIAGDKAFAVQQKQQQASLKCGRCGRKGHASKDCRSTKDATCHNCGKKGHFAVVCRTPLVKSDQSAPQVKKYGGNRPRHPQGKKKFSGRPLRFVEDNQEASESEEEYVFALGSQEETVTVIISTEPVSMIVDSGASINILNTKAATRLQEKGVEFKKCKRTIHPYGSPPIIATELVNTEVKLPDGESVQAEFLVLPGDQPSLLGKRTSEALGVLRIGLHFVANSVLDLYPGITNGIGHLKDFEVKIHVDPSVTPVARKHSRVPFHLRDKVKTELDNLEAQDIIEKVDSKDATEWVSRIVVAPKPKKPEEIRLCVDMRDANKAIKRTRHVTPTLEELMSDMSGATVFSKIDLKAGYHQLTLDKSSRGITTFSTHAGLYRYKRLSFGINSAAETFQHTIQTVIADVKGAKNASDDIIVFGKDREEHDKNLHSLLATLHKAGLTVNASKCEFGKTEIEFYGFIFSKDGLKPDPRKVAALNKAEQPQNVTELRSFLGMAQYSARFIPNFATLTAPLRQLTKQDEPWRWTEQEEKAHASIKTALCETATLAYFDIKKKTEVIVDASPVGVAALLSQEETVICYASRALSEVEQRYSQTEREALAIVWACEHFDIYTRGHSFTVITDHKPLTTIWEKPSPPARIARWALRLQPYQMNIQYRPGKDNPADYLSRHPVDSVTSSREEKAAEEFIQFITDTNTPVAVTNEDVRRATTADPILVNVMELVRTGRWHERPPDMSMETFRAFRNVKDSLCINAEQDIILQGTLVVIPSALQDKVIKLAHEGHQGINKTKALLRSKVWFPDMTAKAENAVRECIPCQANSNRRNMEPLAMSELPAGAWQNLSLDFCGPLPTGESLLVIQDEYSRYPVVEIVRKTSVDSVIPIVDKVFAEFGYPKVIKTDNGPQFRSATWKDFLTHCGVRHRKITPLWPRSNSQAEAFNKPLLKSIRSAKIQHKNWKQELYTFLRMYRCTPHATTLFSPHYLLFGREPRTKMPQLAEPSNHPVDEELRQRDGDAKRKMKSAADRRHHAKPSRIIAGDKVLVRQAKQDKFSSPYWPKPLLVTASKGTMITAAKADGSTVTRNAAMFRKLPDTMLPATQEDEDCARDETIFSDNDDDDAATAAADEGIAIRNGRQHPDPVPQPSPSQKQAPLQPHPRRSRRNTRTPGHLSDYVLDQ